MMSPKCPKCLERGYLSGTHKIAGQPKFLCSVCGTVHSMNHFKDIDYHWHDKRVEWESVYGKIRDLTTVKIPLTRKEKEEVRKVVQRV